MRIFNEPNKSNDWKCPVCKTSDDGKVVLISIVGTKKGNIAEAEQIHLDCLDLWFDKTLGVIYQKLEN